MFQVDWNVKASFICLFLHHINPDFMMMKTVGCHLKHAVVLFTSPTFIHIYLVLLKQQKTTNTAICGKGFNICLLNVLRSSQKLPALILHFWWNPVNLCRNDKEWNKMYNFTQWHIACNADLDCCTSHNKSICLSATQCHYNNLTCF